MIEIVLKILHIGLVVSTLSVSVIAMVITLGSKRIKGFFLGRKHGQHVPKEYREKAKAIFDRVEAGELKKETLGNEADPDDGKCLYQSYQALMQSDEKIETIITMEKRISYGKNSSSL